MEQYIDNYIAIVDAFDVSTADNELVQVEELTVDQMRQVKQRALKLIDERELQRNIHPNPNDPSVAIAIGHMMMGKNQEEQHQIMIEELIRVNADNLDKLRAIKADVEKSDLSEEVKNNIYNRIQQLTVGVPFEPPTPEILREYVEPQMRFTRSIINKGVENAMRYLPPF